MSHGTVCGFVNQFSEAFSALSVDNCIAACGSVASAVSLSIFDKEQLAKECVEVAADPSQPLSSRVLAVFLLERCVAAFQAESSGWEEAFGKAFAEAITAGRHRIAGTDSATTSTLKLAMQRLPAIEVWTAFVVEAALATATAWIGEEDHGLKLAGELLCLVCEQSTAQPALLELVTRLDVLGQLHRTVLGSLETGVGLHTSNYLKRVIPTVYHHPVLQQAGSADAYQGMLQECWDRLCQAFSTATHEQKENGSIVACLMFDLLADRQPTSHGISLWDIAFSLVDDVAPILRKRGLHVIERLLGWKGRASKQAVDVWRRWLIAYEALASATQLHIVEQMWPTVVELAKVHTPDTSHADEGGLPPLSFRWISLLLNLLLVAGVSSIRRISIVRILRRHVVTSLDGVFIEWVCDRLLPALDLPAYFKRIEEQRVDTNESGLVYKQLTRVQISGGNDDDQQQVAKGEYSVPGVYVRGFIESVLADMTPENRSAFLRALIERVCAQQSVHTVHLVLDVFAGFASIPPLACLDVHYLEVLRAYLGERILASNNTILAALGDSFVSVASMHAAHGVPMHLISKVVSKFHWTDCLQRWVPQLQSTAYAQLAASDIQPSDRLGIFAAILLAPAGDEGHAEAKQKAEQHMTAVLSIADRMIYEPYIAQEQVDAAIDALKNIVAPVIDAVHYAHTTETSGAFADLVRACSAAVVRLAESLVPFAQAALRQAEGATLRPDDAVYLLQGALCCCAHLELSSDEQQQQANKTHTIVHGVATAIANSLAQLSAPGAGAWETALTHISALRVLMHTLRDCLRHTRRAGAESATSLMREICTAEIAPQLVQVISACRTLRIPSKRDYEAYKNTVGDVELKFPRYSDMCRAYLTARWGAQAYCALLADELGHQQDLGLNSTEAVEECMEALEMVSEESVYLLSLCFQSVFRATLRSAEPTDELRDLVTNAIERAWQTARDVTVNVGETYYEFIQLAFDPVVFKFMEGTSFHKDLFEEQVQLGLSDRPHSLRVLVGHMCGLWMNDPMSMVPYLRHIRSLLMYKEPDINEAQAGNVPTQALRAQADWSRDRRTEASSSSGNTFFNSPVLRFVVRFVLLHLLEKLHEFALTEPAFGDAVRNEIILPLLELSNTPEMIKAAMVGTDEYNQKLRAWQALCVLGRYVDASIIQQVNSLFWPVVKHICAHGIRFHVETFGCMLTLRFPDIALPCLIEEILCFSHKGQIIASLFIILGCVLTTARSIVQGSIAVADYLMFPELEAAAAVVMKHMPRVLRGVLPYLGSVQGFTRVIAQLLAYQILKNDPRTQGAESKSVEEGTLDDCFIRECWRYLHENPEMCRVRQKQEHFFETYQPLQLCSLAGLAYVPFDEFGELCPVHLLAVVSQCLKDVAAELKVGEDELAAPKPVLEQPSGMLALTALQRKIVPFDALQLEVEGHVLTRRVNEVGRKRQRLVVCASMIDKVPNLAGLARTCEIFAAEKLTIPNKTITEHDQFKSIAVSAQDWVPIEEVKEEDIVHFLRSMKKEGYTVVGLEQTGDSKLIHEAPLEGKIVLVLGKEKEGIPVEILQETHYCIEIPQFGVTRSLNVHVSAAVAIWEYTKKQLVR